MKQRDYLLYELFDKMLNWIEFGGYFFREVSLYNFVLKINTFSRSVIALDINLKRMKQQHFSALVFIFFIGTSSGVLERNSSYLPFEDFNKPRSPRLPWLWFLQSLLGLVGSVLNSVVLLIFIGERQSMATSVNSMIW